MSNAESGTHIVLIGASIGQDWRLSEWPQRVSAEQFSAESIAVWQFDKSTAVEDVLVRPGRRVHLTRSYLRSLFAPAPRRPDVVILKECSSYFPGVLEQQRKLFQSWAEQLAGAGFRVVLATVVPVTRGRAARDPGKIEQIVEFNRWIRSFARDRNLELLDLDAALRGGTMDPHLQEQYALSDGSHLNRAAYAVLDEALLAVTCRIRPAASCAQGERSAVNAGQRADGAT